MVGAASDGEVETEEEEERKRADHSGAGAFHVVGTVSARCEDRAYVLEEYFVSISSK